MRKSQREVSDINAKYAALLNCGYMTLALNSKDGVPYAIPLNFGAKLNGERLYIYFHCALAGTKLNLMRDDTRVGFCAANMLRTFNNGTIPCGYTTDYESVCGTGVARILTDEDERLNGLNAIMEHYAGQNFPRESYEKKSLSLTCVVEIAVDEWTCKRLIRP